MTKFLLWLECLFLVYVLTAVLNPVIGLGSVVTPLWLWSCILVIPFLFNYIYLKKSRNLLSIILVNFPIVFVTGVLPIVMYQMRAGGQLWPAAVPAVFEVVILWSSASFLLLATLLPKQRVIFFEIGLMLLALIMNMETSVNVPYLLIIVSSFVLAGLLLEAISNSESTHFAGSSGRKRRWLPIVASLGLTGIGLAFGSLVASKGFTGLLQDFVSLLLTTGRKIAQLFDTLGLNKPVGTTNNVLKIPNYVPVQNDATMGGAAPLWFMIILWVVLAVLIVAILFMLIVYIVNAFREIIGQLRSFQIESKPQQKRSRFIVRLNRSTLVTLFKYIGRRFHKLGNNIIIRFIGMRATNVNELYVLFLYWGKRIGKERLPAETPLEYLKRLSNVFGESYPNLLIDVNELTDVFYRERYGGLTNDWSREAIDHVSKILNDKEVLSKVKKSIESIP